ncbi:hypothetical protein BGAL_0190g00020 [Botrytis galanthina]|uniref:Uncharacterized protein n=1 Tax=Botrytis galanthina TaxID=278940 RepID=A0A4S8QW37_9HELO|nr:hypothetical protein BGAL_0190g00020 [Botrytis galanthina]
MPLSMSTIQQSDPDSKSLMAPFAISITCTHTKARQNREEAAGPFPKPAQLPNDCTNSANNLLPFSSRVGGGRPFSKLPTPVYFIHKKRRAMKD